jgi:DNA topoisomerase-3
MRLFIAEKPSLARAIADALPAPASRARHHIACGDDVVAWCAGHILRMAPPEAYGDEHKTWRLDALPIVPRVWKLEIFAPELLKSIATLLKSARRVVHAGDPDREGQLLVEEVLHFLGYTGPVDRLLITDLSADAVRRQLRALEPNAKYRPLHESALARQRADWLYGMNMTRLYTLLGRAGGYTGVLSVGRVQTPLLGLIVARDRAIADFRPVPYYVVTAEIRTRVGETFRAAWVPGAEADLDPDGRPLSRAHAEEVRQRALGQEGRVTDSKEERKIQAPPLPYALAALQVEAGRRFGMSAHQVLEACQSLYEAHRLLTYPRSDCAYLPEDHHAQARDVLASVGQQAPDLRQAIGKAALTLRSKAWDDTKITAHHAIVPTPVKAAASVRLSDRERAVYDLVCRRYLAQFYPPHEYLQTRVELELGGERFAATGRQPLVAGWKVLSDAEGDDEPPQGERGDSKDPAVRLPHLARGEGLTATDVAIADKRTEPPKRFNDASLIAAMCGVAKFVRNPAIKKILTEADGIGTPATRAAIIETLFERAYIERVGRAIVSTETGRAVVASLPEVATTPDMTAMWEAAMRAITEGAHTLDGFLERVGAQLEQLVAEGRALGRIAVPAAPPASLPPRRSARHRTSGAGARHNRSPANRRRRPS